MSDQTGQKTLKADSKGNKNELDLDPKLLEMLVCPVTHGPLRYDREKQELISDQAGLAYPVRDGIPIMLSNEARLLSNAETS